MVPLFVFSFCLLVSSPVFSFEHKKSAEEILNFVESVDLDNEEAGDLLMGKFDDLVEEIDESEDPVAEAREFLQVFLNEIQERYGVVLTIPQACELVKQNLDMFELSDEELEEFLVAIDFLAQEMD